MGLRYTSLGRDESLIVQALGDSTNDPRHQVLVWTDGKGNLNMRVMTEKEMMRRYNEYHVGKVY